MLQVMELAYAITIPKPLSPSVVPSWLGYEFEEGDEIRSVLGIRDRIAHLLARDQAFRVCEPAIQSLLSPFDMGVADAD
jgi:hypothetical protein